MNLKGIISISGKAGLYKVVAQGKNNVIVESLEDKKRMPAYSSDRISALEDISIYTYDEDVLLKDILKKIYEKETGLNCISHKEDKAKLENYLNEILPNYDKERVYISDVKKIFQWYNLLHASDDLKVEKTETPLKDKKEKSNKIETKTSSKVTTKNVTSKTSAPKKATTVKTGVSRGK
jgi:hypothetical protein